MKKFINTVLFLLLAVIPALAQDVNEESLFRQSGKIYVVVAILSVIFLGIIAYLITIDVRLGRIEKNKKEEQK